MMNKQDVLKLAVVTDSTWTEKSFDFDRDDWYNRFSLSCSLVIACMMDERLAAPEALERVGRGMRHMKEGGDCPFWLWIENEWERLTDDTTWFPLYDVERYDNSELSILALEGKNVFAAVMAAANEMPTVELVELYNGRDMVMNVKDTPENRLAIQKAQAAFSRRYTLV